MNKLNFKKRKIFSENLKFKIKKIKNKEAF